MRRVTLDLTSSTTLLSVYFFLQIFSGQNLVFLFDHSHFLEKDSESRKANEVMTQSFNPKVNIMVTSKLKAV